MIALARGCSTTLVGVEPSAQPNFQYGDIDFRIREMEERQCRRHLKKGRFQIIF